MNFKLTPLLISKKRVIFLSFLDCIFFTIFIIKSNLGNIGFSNLFSLISIFIFSSYIIGRYSFYGEKLKYYALKQAILSLCSFIILYLTGYLTGINIILKNDLIVFLNLIIISFVSNIIITNQINKLSKNNIYKWILIGSNQEKYLLEKAHISEDAKIIIEKHNLNALKNLKIDNYDGIIISNKEKDLNQYEKILNNYWNKTQIVFLTEWMDKYLHRNITSLMVYEDLTDLNLSRRNSLLERRLKRIFDVFASLVILLFSLPLVILSSLLIILEDGGGVFYQQYRTGINLKPFKIIKLRTMKVNSEEKGIQWARKKDPRISKIGTILRKTRLDEIPQLWKVFTGEMSLIGPRPERPEIDKELAEVIPFYKFRYKVRPGLSGWAQVNYPYGASIRDAEYKLSYDIYYIRHFSIFLDLLIFFKTIRLIITASGSEPKR